MLVVTDSSHGVKKLFRHPILTDSERQSLSENI